MKKLLLLLFIISYSSAAQPSLVPAVDIPLIIKDNAGGKKELRFGLDPSATDYFDYNLGEQTQPPMPPPGVIAARFNIGYNFESSLKDYRQGHDSLTGTRIHYIHFQPGKGDQITVCWNFPDGISGIIQDNINGSYISRAMSGDDSLVVSNPLTYSTLKMTIYYQLWHTYATKANIKVLLQGAAYAGNMYTPLRNQNLLPLSQPYNTPPWNYNGSEKLDSLPSNTVDWVLVELRSGTAASALVARRAALLLSDASIVDVDGATPVIFENVKSGNYYLVIRHRNHLSVMSADPVPLDFKSALYDFRTSLKKFYGNEAYGSDSYGYGLYACDANNDAQITSLDFNIFNPKFNSAVKGYELADWNMDGQITSKDFNLFNNNFIWARSSKVPEL